MEISVADRERIKDAISTIAYALDHYGYLRVVDDHVEKFNLPKPDGVYLNIRLSKDFIDKLRKIEEEKTL